MDPQTPRELGDIEDAEAERRAPNRSLPVKKSLGDFLAEFEQRLRDSPGEPATSAQAALEGRARGVWRTPVESGERSGRRPARRPPWRPDPDTPRDAPGPPAAPVNQPVTPAGETEVAMDQSAGDPTAVAEPLPALAPPADEGPDATSAGENAEVAAAADDGPVTGRKRHRRQRRHRRH